jgi:hypothetical protein
MKARLVGVVCAGLAVALLASVSNAALMTIAVEINPSTPGYVDSTHAVVAPGATVTLDVYAVFGGTNGNNADDGIFGTVYGALKSSAGGLLGNLAFTPASVVSASGFAAGTVKDLDADTDLDVGGTNGQAATDWIILMSGANTLAPAGAEDRLRVGTATFTLTNTDAAGTDVGWVYRNKTGLGNLINAIKVDGQAYTLAGSDSRLAVATANIKVPEPATMAILALGGLGVLLRRKKA